MCINIDKCSLYFEAVCKLHTCCIRMNIMCESLAKGRGIACIGRRVRKSMQLTVCVIVAHVRDLPFPLPNSGLQL